MTLNVNAHVNYSESNVLHSLSALLAQCAAIEERISRMEELSSRNKDSTNKSLVLVEFVEEDTEITSVVMHS